MSASSDALSEFLRLLFQAGIVVLGWAVVHKLSAARDRDKARRELVAKSADALSDGLEKLLTEAYAYHRQDRSLAAEMQLKLKLQDLSVRLNGLSEVNEQESVLGMV